MESWNLLGSVTVPAVRSGGGGMRRRQARTERRALDTYVSYMETRLADGNSHPFERSQVSAATPALTARRRAVPATAGVVNGATFPAADHSVKLYKDDAEIVRSIADFYEEGIGAGETLVLVATADHRQAVEATLAARGLDLGAAYVALDARETLNGLLVDGSVDADLFDAIVGRIVRGLVAEGRPVRIYGEMVGLLWAGGDVVGATAGVDLHVDVAEHGDQAVVGADVPQLEDRLAVGRHLGATGGRALVALAGARRAAVAAHPVAFVPRYASITRSSCATSSYVPSAILRP